MMDDKLYSINELILWLEHPSRQWSGNRPLMYAKYARAELAQLREVATAAREYLDISDVPRIHGDYCKYCEADVTAAHEKDCEFIIKVTSLVAALAALEQEQE